MANQGLSEDAGDCRLIPQIRRSRLKIPRERCINHIDAFSHTPHFELIRPGKSITVASVLITFARGISELFPFLAACRMLNCSVKFKKEKIVIAGRSEDCWCEFAAQMRRHIAEGPKNADACRRYLGNIDKLGLITALPDESEPQPERPGCM